jgi:hypothetical protein
VPGSLLVLGGSWRLVKTTQKIIRETLAKSSKKCLEGYKITKNGDKIYAKSKENDLGAPRVGFGRASWRRNLKK